MWAMLHKLLTVHQDPTNLTDWEIYDHGGGAVIEPSPTGIRRDRQQAIQRALRWASAEGWRVISVLPIGDMIGIVVSKD